MNQPLLPTLTSTTKATETRDTIHTVLRQSSPQDWLVFAYLVYLNVALLPRYGMPGYAHSFVRMFGLLLTFLLVVVPVRAGWFRDGFWAPLGYRAALQGSVQTSYFFFAAYLPLVNPGVLDEQLFAFDLRWFGFEPCLVLDNYITGFTAEWFAFFYFCYFLVLTVHTLPILLFERRARLLGEFSFGMLMLFCVGHVLYTLVPGYGPYRAIAHLFQNSLPSGHWVDLVLRTVATGGAQKDIFPSLHTAAPTFITLFSFRHRATTPFRYSWPLMAFFTVNIVIATMFMRWHWLVDVAAGLSLAGATLAVSVLVTRWDLSQRARHEKGPSWPVFTYSPLLGPVHSQNGAQPGAPAQPAPGPAQKPS
jgi:hypothetical protein